VTTPTNKNISLFDIRGPKDQIEGGVRLTPNFDDKGLLPCAVSDYVTGDMLMLAFMNAEALARTIETGEAYYWSRSRQKLWHKGATSGHIQKVVDVRIDCDQDAVWLLVKQTGAACHNGYRSCFYRSIPVGGTVQIGQPEMKFTETEKIFDLASVHNKS
tara:strand:- start:173 stop:649 length:477 start_codon:yes stop_codon:yes gene_type:complete